MLKHVSGLLDLEHFNTYLSNNVSILKNHVQVIFVSMVIVLVVDKPKPLQLIAPIAFSAPIVDSAPAVVTATSSQIFATNYNGFAASLVAAPAPLAYEYVLN